MIIICGLISCEYDFKIDIPPEKKLVAQCNFSPKENFIVFLSTNNTVTDTTDRTFFPRNAEVNLYENDRYVETLEFIDDFFNQVHYRSNMIPEAKNKYSIRAYLENYDSIYSEDIIPEPIDISQVLFSSIKQNPEGSFPHWMNFEVGINISIETPNIEEKFFHLILKKKEKFIDSYTGDTISFSDDFKLDISVPELSFEAMTHESGILFKGSDLKEMGNEFEIVSPFLFDTMYDVRSPIILELRNVTENYYRFHKSMSAQNVLSFQQNLISNQAIRIYNNIENGLGNFSAYNISTDSIRWYE